MGVLVIIILTPVFDVRFFPSGDVTSYEVRGESAGKERAPIDPPSQYGGLKVLSSQWLACNATSPAAPGVAPLPRAPGLMPGAACAASFADAVTWYAGTAAGLTRLEVGGHDLAPAFSLPATPLWVRREEMFSVTLPAASAAATPLASAAFERRWAATFQAVLNLCRTAFLCSLLALSIYFFSHDAERLVLQPIQRMVSKVEAIAANPLAAMSDDGSRGGSAVPLADRCLQLQAGGGRAKAKEGRNYETFVLERCITKICSLMAVGFGDAGAEIIAENMRTGGALNPMVPGKKILAIFGFCDIRQFTDATEVLQEEVMEFVNSIASVVHSEVARHGGSANKNIGDAFLLVWKFPPECSPEDVTALATGGTPKDPAVAAAAARVADSALAAFVLINAALRRSPKMAAYAANPRLAARMPGFRVRMGYGLHVGWAIEGAIGSLFKVDASYLSPNVNMAARLEAATKQFDVPLLLSEDFVRLLGPAGRAACRPIDRVTVKGSAKPLGLHVFDADPDFLPAADPAGCEPVPREPGVDELTTHPDIVAMRGTVDPGFLARFALGYAAYAKGDWAEAARVLEGTVGARPGPGGVAKMDGPSRTLLGVMAAHGNRAPPGWQGFRELTEK